MIHRGCNPSKTQAKPKQNPGKEGTYSAFYEGSLLSQASTTSTLLQFLNAQRISNSLELPKEGVGLGHTVRSKGGIVTEKEIVGVCDANKSQSVNAEMFYTK